MPRDLPLGNGSLLVSFDEAYNLRDLYFPRVGMENHTAGEPCRTGVWVDGKFAWLSDRAWRKRLRYQPGTMVTEVCAQHDALGLRLTCNDAVDLDQNLLLRRITITNLADRAREVRVFFHYDFHIYGVGVGDTVYYEPTRRTIVAYKGRRYFLMSGCVEGRYGASSWATGQTEVLGREGTWRDAEDGQLSGNPIAQGSVDVTLGLHGVVPAGSQLTLYHWLGAGRTLAEVQDLDAEVQRQGPEFFLTRSIGFWQGWLTAEQPVLRALPPELADLYQRSLLIMRTHADAGGALISSADWDATHFNRDTYCYMWPRDAALVALAFAAAGYGEIPRRFFEFCNRVVTPGGYLMHKYNPTGDVGSSWHPWLDSQGRPQLPIQEDETGLVLYSLWQHYTRWRDIEFIRPLYRRLVKNTAEFLCTYREPTTGLPAPSYDLWEERHGIHTFTVAAVWAGLQAAANFADLFHERADAAQYREAAQDLKTATSRFLFDRERNHFVRRVQVRSDGTLEVDATLDASLTALVRLGMYRPDDPRVVSTMDAIEQRLWCRTAVGGLARYEGDPYFLAQHDAGHVPGNPWFICTLWLAQYYLARARTQEDLDRALALLRWVEGHALPSGVLAEQLNPQTGAPLSVSPLIWSHAEFVLTVQQLLARQRALTRRAARLREPEPHEVAP
ncbi:MAG: glycoside hydrolase family 15 protein [Chloroflexi bacterium]|nr:glycoside hydrolase family 15 protein [Chloroflexota bacterium]